MSQYSYYHECLYNCINNCCNQFGTCPEDYVNTIFANEKRYTQCFEYADPHKVSQLYPLVDSSIYMAIMIALVLLLAVVSLINLYIYMSRLLRSKSKGNSNEQGIEMRRISNRIENGLQNSSQKALEREMTAEQSLANDSVDDERKALEI